MRFILGTDRDGQLVCPQRARFHDHCSILGNPPAERFAVLRLVLLTRLGRHDDANPATTGISS